jgi:hypothetical protein
VVRERIQIPIGRGFDRAYWLSRCEGFLVETAEGMRIGTVVELHYRSRLDQPDDLLVQAGRFGLRLLTYPAEAVETIFPGQARLLLAAGAAPISSGRHDRGDDA